MKYSSKEFKKYATKHVGIPSTRLDGYQKYMYNNPVITGPFAMTPNIIEERKMNAVAMDVFSRLLIDRIIFLGTAIDDYVANIINAQLLFLQSSDSKRDIQIYLNSPGGEVLSGLGLVDTMNYVSPNITTINTGLAASMAFVILCSGTKGKRLSLPHARVMQHQPSGGAQGTSADMSIAVKQIEILREELYQIISKCTGQDIKRIRKDADRDHWMTSKEAKDYGVIDRILCKGDKN